MENQTSQQQAAEQANLLTPALLEKIYADRQVRTAITRQSHLMFFNVYFPNYVTHPTAPFQKEIFAITENTSIERAIVVAFRGSGKSTIVTMSYPLWAILGEQQKKFILILSQTQRQARQHLLNIKRELEANELLRSDLGPFQEEPGEWGSLSLVIPRYDARIMAASTEQSVRGLRHGEHRPDLIICDDIEDLQSVNTKEGRDKTHQWLSGDVIPSGDLHTTRLIIVGNLLHEDSVLMRLRRAIEEQDDGVFVYRQYPLVDGRGASAWPGRYPAPADLEALQRTIGDEASWQREYLLRIISGAERVVHPEWLHYYDYEKDWPRDNVKFVGAGVDLAISQRETADYTAVVAAGVVGYHNEERNPVRIYVLPNPINARLTFPETVDTIKALHVGLPRSNSFFPEPHLYVEDYGYQQAMHQMLATSGVEVESPRVRCGDKRSRIALTSHLIREGVVLFPKTGCEELIQQLVGFGAERHDDLADAFAILINSVMQENHYMPRVTWI